MRKMRGRQNEKHAKVIMTEVENVMLRWKEGKRSAIGGGFNNEASCQDGVNKRIG